MIRLHYKKYLHHFLYKQKDNSPLVVFRIFFGLLVFLECGGAILTGWVKEAFVEPENLLTFIGFEWLGGLAGEGMYYYYGVMALLGLLIMLGCYYKLATTAFTVLWWGCYLMQKSHYNNHYYLLILLNLFMIIVPAHRYFSIDVKRNPSLKSYTCPVWCFNIFILQVWIVFTYAAVAKFYPDWLQGKPVGIWFSSKGDYPIIGPLLVKKWFQLLISYGGIFFDLLVVPLLLWRRTRILAFMLCLVFNIFNSAVFQIGIFPYLMIAFSVFFFPPEVARKLFLRKRRKIQPELLTIIDNESNWAERNVLPFALLVYFLIQIWLPLRYIQYPGNPHWTEEGHRMSWHMMLRSKSGYSSYILVNEKTGMKWTEDLNAYFSPEQIYEIAKLPDMAWQAAQFLKQKYAKEGIKVKVYVDSRVSLNGGPWMPLIDPKVDLANEKWHSFKHSKWVLPYENN